jgi:hypothetical protein
MIYKCFSGYFWAPLFHALFPNVKFWVKPKRLSSIIAMMNFVRIAYPYFEEDLEEALAEVGDKETAKCHLLNLKAFCIFFIPAVRLTTRTQRAQFSKFFRK